MLIFMVVDTDGGKGGPKDGGDDSVYKLTTVQT